MVEYTVVILEVLEPFNRKRCIGNINLGMDKWSNPTLYCPRILRLILFTLNFLMRVSARLRWLKTFAHLNTTPLRAVHVPIAYATGVRSQIRKFDRLLATISPA